MNTMGSHEWRGSHPQHDEIERLQHNLQVTAETKDQYAALAAELLAEIEQLRVKFSNLEDAYIRQRETSGAMVTHRDGVIRRLESELTVERAKVSELESKLETERAEQIAYQIDTCGKIATQAEQIKLARESIGMLMRLCEMCSVPDGPVIDFAKKALTALDSVEYEPELPSIISANVIGEPVSTQDYKLLGEVRNGAVVWFDKNPHAFEDQEGTKFYAAQEGK